MWLEGGRVASVGGQKNKYLDGAIKAGIPIGIVNLTIICALYLLWIGLGHNVFTGSGLYEMPPGTDTSELLRTNSMQFWLILFAIAICPIISVIVSTFAGMVSAGVNAISDEKEAEMNGRITGKIMWAIVMIAGLVFFGVQILYIINMILLGNVIQSIAGIIFLLAFIGLPIVLIFWVFLSFSVIGSRIFVRMNPGSAISIESIANIVKTCILKGDRSWIKTSVKTLVILWVVLLFYSMLMMISQMH
jgi:hypothetical protein